MEDFMTIIKNGSERHLLEKDPIYLPPILI